MTIQKDVMDALAGLSAPVHQEFAPEGTPLPYVIVRRVSSEPLNLLSGYSGQTKSTFVFECWERKKSAAVELAAAVRSAIEGATAIETKSREPVSGEDFAPEILVLMEPVEFSFWHDE
jgi:uncharacterized protein DUF3168